MFSRKTTSTNDCLEEGFHSFMKSRRKETFFSSYTAHYFIERSQRLFEDLSEPEVDAITLENMAHHKEKVVKRLDHALRRIKSKGYYADNLHELMLLSQKHSEATGEQIQMILSAASALSSFPDCTCVKIPDDVWYLAIDAAMYSLHPEHCQDVNSLFGPYIDNDIGEIYRYTVLYAFIAFQEFFVSEYRDFLEFESDEMFEEDNLAEQTDLQLQTLQHRHNETKNELESVRTEKKVLNKQILKLEHELKKVQKESEEKVSSLKEQNEQLLEFILHRGDPIEEAPDDTQLPPDPNSASNMEHTRPLPSKRVLFLGGHPNLVKKVEDLHPDWLFLGKSNVCTYGNNIADVIFFWTGHASHKLQRKVFAGFTNLPPVIYVTSTNIDLLEKEMLVGYNALLER